MRFSDLAQHELRRVNLNFGSYLYEKKGPENVVNMPALMYSLKALPVEEALIELKHLAHRTDCPLEPIPLVSALMNQLEKNIQYYPLFEDDDLFDCCFDCC